RSAAPRPAPPARPPAPPAEPPDPRRHAPKLSPLEASDREEELADWLEDHEVNGAWEIAPTLLAAGVDQAWLERVAQAVPPPHLAARVSVPVPPLEAGRADGAGRHP